MIVLIIFGNVGIVKKSLVIKYTAMNTTTFDTEKAKQVETAVCREFGSSIAEVLGYGDTMAKKVVVFVLFNYLGYDKRVIGHKYQMTYLYVPTVVSEIEFLIKTLSSFETKINEVLKNCIHEKNLDTARDRDLATALS